VLTYGNVENKKISGGITIRSPLQGRGGEGKVEEGKG